MYLFHYRGHVPRSNHFPFWSPEWLGHQLIYLVDFYKDLPLILVGEVCVHNGASQNNYKSDN